MTARDLHPCRAAGFVLVVQLVSALAFPARATNDTDLLVFGAASLRDALPALVDAYARRDPHVHVQVHSAGSTALREQIAAGAPADVFVSADPADMRTLVDTGQADEALGFAGNRLVVAGPADRAPFESMFELVHPAKQRVAVGNPATAPVGRYTGQALARLGLANRLAGRLVLCENARQITSTLASGACDLAIAYRTDVQADTRLGAVWVFSDTLHARIEYQATALRRARDADAARDFVRFLTTPVAADILARHGFVTGDTLAVAHDELRHTDTPALPRARPDRWTPVWLSLRVAALATMVAGTLGIVLAAWLARQRAGWLRDVSAALTDLPLVLPPTVIGLALLELGGPRGPFGIALERFGDFRWTFTWFAAVVASTVMATPLMVRTARAGFESVPERYVEAARTLGASRWSAFWSVQLPLARRSVVAGLVLCFFRALGEFGATLMVAGNIPGRTQTLPLAIYSAVFEGQPRDAVVWVAFVLLLSWSGAFAAQRLTRTATS